MDNEKKYGTFCEKCRNVMCVCAEHEAWDYLLTKYTKEASESSFGLFDWLKDNYLPPSDYDKP